MVDYPFPTPGFVLASAEAANDDIETLIGTSFPIFTNTILFCQNSRNRSTQDFVDADSSTQQEIFRTLFHLNCYEESLDFVARDFKSIKLTLDDKQSIISNLEIQISEKTSIVSDLSNSYDLWSRDKESGLSKLRGEISDIKSKLLGSSISELKNRLVELQQQLSKSMTDAEQASKTYLEKLTAYSAKVSTLESLEKSIEDQRKAVLEAKEPIQKPDGYAPEVLDNITSAKSKLEEELSLLKEYRIEHEQSIQSITKSIALTTKDLEHSTSLLVTQQRQRGLVLDSRKDLESKINSLSCCPTCQQEFSNAKAKAHATRDLTTRLDALQLPPDDSELEKKIQDLSASLASLKSQSEETSTLLTKIENALKFKTSELSDVNRKLDAIQSKIEQQKTYEIRLLDWKVRLDKEQLDLEQLELRVPALKRDIAIFNEQKLSAEDAEKAARDASSKLQQDYYELKHLLDQELNPLEKEHSHLTDLFTSLQASEFPQLSILETQRKALSDCQASVREAQASIQLLKSRFELLESIEVAFGKEGIVSELFREYIPEIQALSDKYLSDLTNGELCIDWSAEKELKKKLTDGSNATKNQFSIRIRKAHGGGDYDLISGSEQHKGAFVVNWALAELAYRESNIHCSFHVFDEVFDSLDAKGMERLAQTILNNKKDGVTFVITHKVELEDVFPNKIVLEKKDGVSSLKEII